MAVYGRLPALSGRQLDRLPEWTRRAHEQLLAARLEAVAPAPPSVEAMSRRLDRLQRPTGTDPARPSHDVDR